MQGDCLELMKQIPDGSVDMILCDLPYGTTACKWDSVIPFEPLWEQYKRIAKPNAAIVLTAQTPFDKVLALSNLQMLRYEWIWEKEQGTGGMNANKMPLKKHENVLVFYKNLPTYNPQFTAGKPYSMKRNKPSTSSVYGKTGTSDGYISVNDGKRFPTSILKFAKETGLHPTQKPVALMEYLIRTYTNEGQTVLDNCMGSGTTGVACANTGRNFIGIEQDAKYFDIAKARIE
jgi:site-specific DNA-methyltransferase (adenine-specific)